MKVKVKVELYCSHTGFPLWVGLMLPAVKEELKMK